MSADKERFADEREAWLTGGRVAAIQGASALLCLWFAFSARLWFAAVVAVVSVVAALALWAGGRWAWRGCACLLPTYPAIVVLEIHRMIAARDEVAIGLAAFAPVSFGGALVLAAFLWKVRKLDGCAHRNDDRILPR